MEPQIDIVFDFAKVFDIVEKVQVVKGQKFQLLTGLKHTARWFSDNDPVISFTEKAGNVAVSADAIGSTTLLILNKDGLGRFRQLEIEVVDEIPQPAVNLGLTAGAPVLK